LLETAYLEKKNYTVLSFRRILKENPEREAMKSSSGDDAALVLKATTWFRRRSGYR